MRTILLAIFFTTLLLAQPPGGGPGGAGGNGDGIWRRNAAYGESQTFDNCLGHQTNTGDYHYHVDPLCLRAQLNDNLVLLRNTRIGPVYQEKASGWTHSPILGWAQDGYPIYGPYGYSDPADASSPVKRMVSSFELRNITTRISLPTWSLPNHSGVSQQLTSSQYGPAVSTEYPLGRYLEDYDYVEGLGDLDQYNGRMTVTPDFPNGTYAYFVTIDANGSPAFPYVISGQYYGAATGGMVQSVTGTLTDYFENGSYAQSQVTTPILASWSTANSKKYAEIISGLDPAAGPTETWPGTEPTGIQTSGSVTSPAYADIQTIRYSSTDVYVNANGLPSYVFGPWFGFQTNGGIFVNFPSAQNVTYEFPSTPAPASSQTSTGGGDVGLWVNGVAVFNFMDGASYSNSAGDDEGPGNVTPGVINVSGASFEGGPVAPSSIVSSFPVFGATIATSTAVATSADWPTTLGGATVTVKDSDGVTRTAQISFASPTQLNFVLPSDTANGVATVTVAAGGSSTNGSLNVVATYPNLFMANSSGLAAAYVVNSQGQVFSVSQPISAGSAASPMYLILAGSGLGKTTTATASIGGVNATVAYAGPQGTYPGVDQYNIVIPPSLAGAGQVEVVVTAAGLPSNAVNVNIGGSSSSTGTTTSSSQYQTAYKSLSWGSGASVSYPSTCKITISTTGVSAFHNAYYLAPVATGTGTETPVAYTPVTNSAMYVVPYTASDINSQSVTIDICPSKASSTTAANPGAIGYTLQGEAIYNPYEGNSETPAMSANVSYTFTSGGTSYTAWFIDQCNSHPTPISAGYNWHHHGVPNCLASSTDGTGPSQIIGIALYGFPIYGGRDINGNVIETSQLDSCNGITSATPEFPNGAYHYVLPFNTTGSKLSMNCYSGTVSIPNMAWAKKRTAAWAKA